MRFADHIARANRAVSAQLANVSVQFLRGSSVRMVMRQTENELGKINTGAREWWLECPHEDLAAIDPQMNELVTVDDIDYSISRIDIDRTGGDWARLTIRPVR